MVRRLAAAVETGRGGCMRLQSSLTSSSESEREMNVSRSVVLLPIILRKWMEGATADNKKLSLCSISSVSQRFSVEKINFQFYLHVQFPIIFFYNANGVQPCYMALAQIHRRVGY